MDADRKKSARWFIGFCVLLAVMVFVASRSGHAEEITIWTSADGSFDGFGCTPNGNQFDCAGVERTDGNLSCADGPALPDQSLFDTSSGEHFYFSECAFRQDATIFCRFFLADEIFRDGLQ